MRSNGKKADITDILVDEDTDYINFKLLYQKIKKKYKCSPDELINKLEKKEFLIPICIFNRKLSTFESICKYLKENLSFSNKNIASLIYKSEKSVWQAYNSSRKKLTKSLKIVPSEFHVPLSILKDSRLTILEAVVTYFKEEQDLNFHKIAVILNRDDRTIWTIYQRAKKKKDEKKKR
tara:strand:+ start:7539 stop:8072 length:534 start_codon:yes stop_codon:yes gene_type:complete